MSTIPFARNAARRAAGQSISEIARVAQAMAITRPDCFVTVCSADGVAEQALQVETALADGADLPLAGLTFSVKDNIDVAGYASTGNCPGYGVIATETAQAARLAMDAGAILIGKNTMDQFATGLNGTRSPDPICRNAINPEIIPGGSSSGSAVAVALNICDFSLGSDTGGSGRVPAAANGIVGFKPTPGLISARGMVYCNRSFDVIPIFAQSVDDVAKVFEVIGGADPQDPFAHHGTLQPPPAVVGRRFAIPRQLDHFGDQAAQAAHADNLAHLVSAGAGFTEIDFGPFKEAGDLVFQSALVAERLIAYGDFIEECPDRVVPSVAEAINAGRCYSARDAFEVLHRLAELRVICNAVLSEVDALVVPTIPRLFTVAEMLANPMALNTVMGTYTYFANPLSMAALAIPGVMRNDGLPSSLCFVAPSGKDLALIKLASTYAISPASSPHACSPLM